MIHGIGYPTAPTTTSPSPSASASPSPSASMSSSPSASAECSKYIGSRTSASASARSSASSWLGGTCATRTSAHLSRKRSIGLKGGVSEGIVVDSAARARGEGGNAPRSAFFLEASCARSLCSMRLCAWLRRRSSTRTRLPRQRLAGTRLALLVRP